MLALAGVAWCLGVETRWFRRQLALSANLLAPPDGKVQDIASLQQTRVPQAVREELMQGASQIKLMAGGGLASDRVSSA